MTKQDNTKTHIKTAMRLPVKLHADIESAAAEAGHSMNDEIIARLSSTSSRATLIQIVEQNQVTQSMVQRILDAITPRK